MFGEAATSGLFDDNVLNTLRYLEDGACNYLELVPPLKHLAERNWLYWWDDNSAGGPRHPVGEPCTFRDQASMAVQNIIANQAFYAASPIAKDLTGLDHWHINQALHRLATGRATLDLVNELTNETLLPILGKIAKQNARIDLPPDLARENVRFGGIASLALQRIERNVRERLAR